MRDEGDIITVWLRGLWGTSFLNNLFYSIIIIGKNVTLIKTFSNNYLKTLMFERLYLYEITFTKKVIKHRYKKIQ